jgi:3-hydroxyisobutyrate dehydrogenase
VGSCLDISAGIPLASDPTSTNTNMKPSAYSLQLFKLRPKSVSFVGLGRMGSEMAFNLFSKTFAKASDSHFVVCDAIPDNARSFCEKFLAHFPGAKIRVAATPEECVFGPF